MSASALPDFRFDCHRCGHCCKVGHGQVWVDEAEVTPLAAAVDMSAEAFSRHYLRHVEGRLSLREHADGACMLLVDGNHCRGYEARPSQCASFPYWPAVLDSASTLAAAARYCPGIQALPDPELAAALLPKAWSLLRRQAEEMESPPTDSERLASAIEVDLVLAGAPAYACREWEAARALEQALQELCEDSGYPWSRGPWRRLLLDRRRAWQEHARTPPLPRLES